MCVQVFSPKSVTSTRESAIDWIGVVTADMMLFPANIEPEDVAIFLFCGQKCKNDQVWRGTPGQKKGPKSARTIYTSRLNRTRCTLLIKAGGSPQIPALNSRSSRRVLRPRPPHRGTDILHRGVHLLRALGFRRHDLSIKLQMLGLNQAANI